MIIIEILILAGVKIISIGKALQMKSIIFDINIYHESLE